MKQWNLRARITETQERFCLSCCEHALIRPCLAAVWQKHFDKLSSHGRRRTGADPGGPALFLWLAIEKVKHVCNRNSSLTSTCEQALLVLDTDGGRLAVKYNSFARKDCREHVKHHRAHLVVASMQHVRNHLAMSACNRVIKAWTKACNLG